jgi:nitrite transporter NirC
MIAAALSEACEIRPPPTLLSIALLAEHPRAVTLAGLGWNLLWVTFGNILSGAGIMGLGYWAASRAPAVAEPAAQLAAAD